MASVWDVALLPFYVSQAASYVTLGGMGYLAWRAVRAYERRGLELEQLQDLARRLDGVEAEQRFTTALLVGRVSGSAHGESGGHAIAKTGNRVADDTPSHTSVS